MILNTTIINGIANFITFASLLVLIVFLFVRHNSVFHKLPIFEHYLIKFGLCIMCAGALFSTIAMPQVIWQQLIRNIGTALVFSWVVFFHYKYFVTKKTKPKPKAKTKKTKPKVKK